MEKDLSVQSEQLLQRLFCDKLSESDRNLLQNWLTSRLTIERCGWKKKLQDTLKMVDQERKTNLEAHAFISKLHEEMKTYMIDNDLKDKYKLENGFIDPLEEVPDLKSYRLKAIYKMWKIISRMTHNQSRKPTNHMSNENLDPENLTDVTISIEAPNDLVTEDSTLQNLAEDINRSCNSGTTNGRYGRRSTISDSANVSLQLKIEKLKNENKQLKNYIENLSKNYQNLFFKYSQAVGESRRDDSSPVVANLLTTPNSGNEETSSKRKQFASREKETFRKSLDIPSSGKQLRNLVLDRNFTMSEVDKIRGNEKSNEKTNEGNNKNDESKQMNENRFIHQQSSESSYSNSSKDNENKIEGTADNAEQTDQNKRTEQNKRSPKFQKSIDLSSESENDFEERRGLCGIQDCVCSRTNLKELELNSVPLKQTTIPNLESKNVKDFLKITSSGKPILPRDTSIAYASREVTQATTIKSKSKPNDGNNATTKNDGKSKSKKRIKNKKEKVKSK